MVSFIGNTRIVYSSRTHMSPSLDVIRPYTGYIFQTPRPASPFSFPMHRFFVITVQTFRDRIRYRAPCDSHDNINGKLTLKVSLLTDDSERILPFGMSNAGPVVMIAIRAFSSPSFSPPDTPDEVNAMDLAACDFSFPFVGRQKFDETSNKRQTDNTTIDGKEYVFENRAYFPWNLLHSYGSISFYRWRRAQSAPPRSSQHRVRSLGLVRVLICTYN